MINQRIYTFPSLFHIAYILRKITVTNVLLLIRERCIILALYNLYLSRSPEKKSSFLILIDFLIPLVIHGFDSRLILRLDNERGGASLLISLFNLL